MARILFAEVIDFKNDPTESGRCTLRIYGRHNDEQKIKDEDLPWGLPIMPCNSASTSGIGISPVGLRKGSRVVITFADNDPEEQYPIILGSFFRGAKAEDVA